jgi:hypothetical protein
MTTIINRLVMHHSAGSLTPTAFDLQHYHRMVTGEGKVLSGKFPISANAIGHKLASGTYAAHTLNLNNGAIGLGMACMAGAEWASPRACKAFPRPEQVDAFVAEAARLCGLYGITVTRKSVLSHAEVQTTLGVIQKGKWDFDYDPYGVLDTRDPVKIGDMLRDRIIDAMESKPVVIEPVKRAERPILRRGAKGEDVEAMQRLLRVKDDGLFGPATEAALIAMQKTRQLLPDGVCGPATWAALEKGN